MAAARRAAAISSPPTHTAKDSLVSLGIWFCLRTRSCDSRVTAYWNPTMSGRVQVRLPLLASHRQHVHEPFPVGRKVRKHDVGSRVLASVLAVWMLTTLQ